MYSPIHATAGVLIGRAVGQPELAFVLGIGSHYVIDAIPHGDTKFSWPWNQRTVQRLGLMEIFDLGIAVAITWWFLHRAPTAAHAAIITGAIGAVLPDILWGLAFVLERIGWNIPLVTFFLKQHNRWHTWIHAHRRYDLPALVGFLGQVLLLGLALFYFR